MQPILTGLFYTSFTDDLLNGVDNIHQLQHFNPSSVARVVCSSRKQETGYQILRVLMPDSVKQNMRPESTRIAGANFDRRVPEENFAILKMAFPSTIRNPSTSCRYQNDRFCRPYAAAFR